MAHSAHTDPEHIKERYDEPLILEQKLDKLAEMVANSKHFVIFTGAGISTDAGIPDFRGPDGKWTLQAQGRTRKGKTVSVEKAIPTVTHMAIVSLQKEGICKYLISQNCDGLHRRSGIRPDFISELHGNGNIEFCEDCNHEYLRDYHCTRIKRGSDHFTGRYCSVAVSKDKVCGGRLMNSTIDFGQSLPVVPMSKGFENSLKADVHLVLGSSLTVTPACDMPRKTAKHGGNLVICNLQHTPLDKYAALRIYARCDTVMKGLMERLKIPIPKWALKRTLTCTVSPSGDSHNSVTFGALESGTKGQAIPASVISSIEFVSSSLDGSRSGAVTSKEPIKFSVPKENVRAKCRIHFMGHYEEPCLDLKVDVTVGTQTYLWLEYDPFLRNWALTNVTRVPALASQSLLAHYPSDSEGSPLLPSDFLMAEGEKCYEDKDYNLLFGEYGLSMKICTFSQAHPLTHVLALSTKENEGKENGGVENEIMGFSPEGNKLVQLKVFANECLSRPCKDNTLSPILARSGFTASQSPQDTFGNSYIFGGSNLDGYYNDVHVFNRYTKAATLIPPAGTPPTPRSFHSATAISQSIIIFGGFGEPSKGAAPSLLNDCYVFNLRSRAWNKLSIQGQPPSPRASHSAMIVDHRTLAIFGGFDGKSYLTDVHLLDLVDMAWRDIESPSGTPPPPQISSNFDPQYLAFNSAPAVTSPASGKIVDILSGSYLLVFSTHSPSVCHALHLVKWNWMTLPSPTLSSWRVGGGKVLGKSKIFLFGKKEGEGVIPCGESGGSEEQGLYGVVDFEILKK